MTSEFSSALSLKSKGKGGAASLPVVLLLYIDVGFTKYLIP
jgi:hypothetical protein